MRDTYLRRPDLGRRLAAEWRAALTPGDYDVVFVIADGLSAKAINQRKFLYVASISVLRPWKPGLGPELSRLVELLLGEVFAALCCGDKGKGHRSLSLPRLCQQVQGAAQRRAQRDEGQAAPIRRQGKFWHDC